MFVSWIGLVYGIGMMTPSTKDSPSRDYDDVVIAHVKKVGDRVVSTNNRPFAMACGLEVIERDKATPGKAAAR